MTSAGHALVAALIAAKFQDPYIALSLSLLSHVPLDILPHWDVGTHIGGKSPARRFIEGSIDIGTGLVLGILVYKYLSLGNNYILLLLCIFFAQLPDWVTAPYTVFKLEIPLIKRIDGVFDKFHNKMDKPWGIITQVAVILILYIVLFHLV